MVRVHVVVGFFGSLVDGQAGPCMGSVDGCIGVTDLIFPANLKLPFLSRCNYQISHFDDVHLKKIY